MISQSEPHAVIYQVLDDVLGGTAVPASAFRRLSAVVDNLRYGPRDQRSLLLAEQVSIWLHKMHTASQQRDTESADTARHHLKDSAVDLLGLINQALQVDSRLVRDLPDERCAVRRIR